MSCLPTLLLSSLLSAPFSITRIRLQATLSPLSELENVRNHLKELNAYDIELFAYAQSLVARRLSRITDIANRVAHDIGNNRDNGEGTGFSTKTKPKTKTRFNANTNKAIEMNAPPQCAMSMEVNSNKLPPELDVQLGIHRPPRHKAPLL